MMRLETTLLATLLHVSEIGFINGWTFGLSWLGHDKRPQLDKFLISLMLLLRYEIK